MSAANASSFGGFLKGVAIGSVTGRIGGGIGNALGKSMGQTFAQGAGQLLSGGIAAKAHGGKFIDGVKGAIEGIGFQFVASYAHARIMAAATAAADLSGSQTDESIAQKNGIQVTDEFEFTEEHARSTLKRFWAEAGRIRGMSSDQLSAWLDGQTSLTQEQMNAAFSLAADMAYAGESAELVGKIYSAGRNPTKILKVLATERVSTGELVENIKKIGRIRLVHGIR